MSRTIGLLGLLLVLLFAVPAAGCGPKTEPGLTTAAISWSQAMTNGKPTLAEFGRGTCIPCKQMKPILEELAKEYKDKLNVLIISVDEYGALTRQCQIMAIPTQIFLGSDGKEIRRHVGFFPKEDIVNALAEMGVK